jgi:heterodisulfide reductase subunit A-like polyferredoxin
VALGLESTWQGEPVQTYLKGLIQKVYDHQRIRLFLHTEAVETTGVLGNFKTDLLTGTGTITATTVSHGATVLAVGGKELTSEEYLYGKHPDVLTHLEADDVWQNDPDRFRQARTVAFIQCVGSRTAERPYCSRLCCTHSLKRAIAIKELSPETNVFILYRDIRSYGFRESLFTEARRNGVLFIRYDTENPPEVAMPSGRLTLEVTDPILGRPVRILPDLLVLATAIVPHENRDLFELFKVPVNADGFLVEAHAKLRPVDFASDGIFMAGLAHGPKSIDEAIAQAMAAASRALTILSRESIQVGGMVAHVREPDHCACCLVCVRSCPYGVPVVRDGRAVIEPAQCHGCGICAAECPAKVITLQHFTDEQLLSKSNAYLFEAPGEAAC